MNNDAGLPACIRTLEYRLPVAALAKWANRRLSHTELAAGGRRYSFLYSGSTCANGGVPYTADLQADVVPAGGEAVLVRGAVIIPPEHRAAVATMCGSRGRAAAFLDGLAASPAFCGQSLEAILTTSLPQNPAGCFCTPPMVQHKWWLALSTVHYALAREAGRLPAVVA